VACAAAIALASCAEPILPDTIGIDPARAIGGVVPAEPGTPPAVPGASLPPGSSTHPGTPVAPPPAGANPPPPGTPMPPAMAVPPGDPVYDAALAGSGACAGNTVAALIAQVHADWPQLGDVQRVYQPRAGRFGGDGSYVYAFAGPGGFALAFRRGGGDCPAGCTENEYWYFATNERCAAEAVGHYRAGWESGTCLSTAGAPLWGVPTAPDPDLVCPAAAP
jgi:hypothetical protein